MKQKFHTPSPKSSLLYVSSCAQPPTTKLLRWDMELIFSHNLLSLLHPSSFCRQQRYFRHTVFPRSDAHLRIVAPSISSPTHARTERNSSPPSIRGPFSGMRTTASSSAVEKATGWCYSLAYTRAAEPVRQVRFWPDHFSVISNQYS